MKLKDLLAQSTVDTPIVRCWEEDVLLPTYETGEFEKNPIFLEKRVYQGSSGVVYPYPVIEKSPINRLRKVGTSFLSKTNTSKS